MARKRKIEVFSLSFLDCISCGFGAVVLLACCMAMLPYKRLVSIRDRRDPLFGGVHPEPIEQYLGALMKAVTEHKAAIGIAHHGAAQGLARVLGIE